ncbi:TMhelix containing protein [Vibrio phage 1.111.B._10N.286.45.E6]|nr:TMhelix containing protein [Vibrio phage 1.111.A._10N.286.45.E6]AUR88258.1 TMhelix containing protein [Vibrio phage 1.111.B._10N.286.45.E6]
MFLLIHLASLFVCVASGNACRAEGKSKLSSTFFFIAGCSFVGALNLVVK